VATKEIQEERIRQLNDKYIREGDYVLYWMQEAQRAEYNHALEYAVQRANEVGQRFLVVFGLANGYPEANLRQEWSEKVAEGADCLVEFMIDGEVYEAWQRAPN